jgi:hypothetical protein
MSNGREGAKVMTGKEEVKTYTVSPEEIEALLQTNFGSKLQQVDGAKLLKLKQRQAAVAAYKTKVSKPKT